MRMYSDYFGIRENAFTITPDPRYLFMSERHREALAHLLFGTEEGGGFVQLTGEVGTGKTTICRAFLEQLPESVDVALLLSPSESPRELLLAIATELQLSVPGHDTSTGELVALLNQRLLETHAAGRRTVVIIDEAQNILPEVLEQVRLLTNLETPTHKLLQVFLIGQPELREKLQHPALRQVAQRITARYHLQPLNLSEVQRYIHHRLAVAGCRQGLFTAAAIRRIHRCSKGIPRVINILCDRALIGAYASGVVEVDGAIVLHAVREWRGEEGATILPRVLRQPVTSIAMTALLIVVAAGFAIQGSSSASGVAAIISNGLGSTADLFGRMGLLPDSLESARHNPVSGQQSTASSTMQARVKPGTEEASAAAGALSAQHIVEMAIPVALKALLDRWGIHDKAADRLALCTRANRYGLSCLNDFGGLEELRSYNRPALLTLHRRFGNEAYLTLTGMDREHVFVVTAKGVVPMPLIELKSYWTGEFMLLWKPPLDGVSLITAGANKRAVQWLQQALQRGDGLVSSAEEFDQHLEQRLRTFQQSHGLIADGIAGPRTLIHLNNLLEHPQIPLLVAAYKHD